jgi:PPOX class probable F420-dependent enzyme
MVDKIPPSHADLLADETRSFAFLATVMKDGSPQVTPVWFNTDGKHILINTAEGRVKDRNMRARPQVALAIMDPKNSYRYIQVQGRIVEITKEGAEDHIDVLNYKYHGKPTYGGHSPEMPRVIYKVLPESVSTMG